MAKEKTQLRKREVLELIRDNLIVNSVKIFTQTMTVLTKYFPFSLFFTNFIFHNKYQKGKKTRDEIKDEFNVYVQTYDKDENFYYFFYKQKDLNYEKLEAKFKDKDIYIAKVENNLIKVSVPRT